MYELSDDRETFAVTHRYLAPGIEPMYALNAAIPADRYPYSSAWLERGRPLLLTPSALPPQAEPERRDLAQSGLEHGMVFPLLLGGRLLGSVFFESRRPPSPALVDSLGLVGELFTSAFAR